MSNERKTEAAVESPTAIEVERALRSIEEAPDPGDCKCGIHDCKGHEVIDGHAIFHDHPLATARKARIRL